MSNLKYVGRTPDSDSTVAPKSFVDTTNTSLAVTTDYVTNAINLEAANLSLQSYVDTQDNLRAHKTDVDAADALYVASSKLGAASGVASLDSSGNLTASQVPAGIVTDRLALSYNATTMGSVFLTGSNTHTVTTTGIREFRLATLTVPDPGFPWRPIPFGIVCGGATGASAPATRYLGTGNYGLLTVCPPSGVSNTVYGIGLCTGTFFLDFFPIIPYAGTNQNPTSVPAITGSLQLDLYGCCWSGSTYTFAGLNMMFSVLVMPSL